MFLYLINRSKGFHENNDQDSNFNLLNNLFTLLAIFIALNIICKANYTIFPK